MRSDKRGMEGHLQLVISTGRDGEWIQFANRKVLAIIDIDCRDIQRQIAFIRDHNRIVGSCTDHPVPEVDGIAIQGDIRRSHRHIRQDHLSKWTIAECSISLDEHGVCFDIHIIALVIHSEEDRVVGSETGKFISGITLPGSNRKRPGSNESCTNAEIAVEYTNLIARN